MRDPWTGGRTPGLAPVLSRVGAPVLAMALLACTPSPPRVIAPVSDAEAAVEEAPPPRPPARPGPAAAVVPNVVPALDALIQKVGGRVVDIDDPCVERDGDRCVRRALDRVYHRLDRRAEGDPDVVRLLLLGDSHIAADYIAKTARVRLQEVFGDAGRGYVHADQRDGYGGRRLPSKGGFVRRRMIDSGYGSGRYGISGHTLVATKLGGSLDFVLDGDAQVGLFLDAHPEGAELVARADGTRLGRADGVADPATTRVTLLDVPPGARTLQLVATGPGVGLLGVDFLDDRPGLVLDAIGPVGADATTYVTADADSFESHTRALAPALIMLMLGGNDALRVRNGSATMEETEARFHLLLDRLLRAAPDADCLVWGPMDAGVQTKAGIKSRTLIGETRDLLRRVAAARGCAFWDLYDVMGGEDSIAAWSKAGIMNADLVHPRAKSGELIGYLFAEALLRDYERIGAPQGVAAQP